MQFTYVILNFVATLKKIKGNNWNSFYNILFNSIYEKYHFDMC